MDTISLSIPASPEYLRVVRLIAAGLASRLGFTIDEIDDLRIGVDELSAYMTGAQGRDGDLTIEFSLDGASLHIKGVAHLKPGQKVRGELTELSKAILGTVVDDAELVEHEGKPGFSLSKSKTSD